jgi:hypothetical protein
VVLNWVKLFLTPSFLKSVQHSPSVENVSNEKSETKERKEI